MHNAVQCDINFDDEHGNEIALGDVAVISNLKNRVYLNGTGSSVFPEQAEMVYGALDKFSTWPLRRRTWSSHGKRALWQPSQRAVQRGVRRGVCRAGFPEPSLGIRGRNRR